MANKSFTELFGWVLFFLALSGHAQTQTDMRKQIVIHYKRAEAALGSGQPAVAAAEFREILKLDPVNAEAYANLGVIAFKQGDLAEAKQLFTDALKHNASLWDAKAFLGLSQIRLGNPKEGVALLGESFHHIHNESLKIDAGVALIKFHQETKTLSQVVDVIRDLQESNPKDPEVLYVVYRAYSELASQSVAALSRSAPDSARMHQVLGEAAMTQDDFPGAILQFRKAAAADAKLPGVHYELGHAILANSQDKAALREAQYEFETELISDPADSNSESELGEVFRLGSNLALAGEHYTRALRLRPDLADAQIGLGNVLIDQGKPADAIAHFTEATRLDPDNEAAHYRLSRAYRAVGRLQDANEEMLQFQKLRQMHGSPPTNSSQRMDDHKSNQ